MALTLVSLLWPFLVNALLMWCRIVLPLSRDLEMFRLFLLFWSAPSSISVSINQRIVKHFSPSHERKQQKDGCWDVTEAVKQPLTVFLAV